MGLKGVDETLFDDIPELDLRIFKDDEDLVEICRWMDDMSYGRSLEEREGVEELSIRHVGDIEDILLVRDEVRADQTHAKNRLLMEIKGVNDFHTTIDEDELPGDNIGFIIKAL